MGKQNDHFGFGWKRQRKIGLRRASAGWKTNKYYIATMQVYDAEGEKKLQDTGDFAREKDLLRLNSRGISGK